ncbi:MAG: hypothetical protein K6A34_08170 [Methanobrevibacter sp.]|nr:hypothetical protein [Methanobrevibacter sp.]
MINLNYELKTEEFEEDEKTVEIKMVEITAETDSPGSRIVFEKSSKLLAETLTNNEGIAVCGFSPQSRKCVVKATCNDETAQVTVPKLADLTDSNE